jgi:hypothetical protein
MPLPRSSVIIRENFSYEQGRLPNVCDDGMGVECSNTDENGSRLRIAVGWEGEHHGKLDLPDYCAWPQSNPCASCSNTFKSMAEENGDDLVSTTAIVLNSCHVNVS